MAQINTADQTLTETTSHSLAPQPLAGRRDRDSDTLGLVATGWTIRPSARENSTAMTGEQRPTTPAETTVPPPTSPRSKKRLSRSSILRCWPCAKDASDSDDEMFGGPYRNILRGSMNLENLQVTAATDTDIDHQTIGLAVTTQDDPEPVSAPTDSREVTQPSQSRHTKTAVLDSATQGPTTTTPKGPKRTKSSASIHSTTLSLFPNTKASNVPPLPPSSKRT